jgi:hypothetical protein
MGTGSFLGVVSGRGVTVTSHRLLVLRFENRVPIPIPLLSLRAFLACKGGETYLIHVAAYMVIYRYKAIFLQA